MAGLPSAATDESMTETGPGTGLLLSAEAASTPARQSLSGWLPRWFPFPDQLIKGCGLPTGLIREALYGERPAREPKSDRLVEPEWHATG
ncbi:hypothetical protein FDG2_4796 [Candidatus Protofrankia californiensis]|uniref:Uncharacterized protein n=1 Tax=Candidatus Protofrankia californiensis TaxID=1839754 RepID=A0A1C3P8L5_9ACTN|nr:hypothetical protein FDG2_4796 [Candidatus Protofrankia californiensis]